LAELLYERHYDATQRNRILRYAIAHRDLTGVVASGELDPEDEAEAYQLLEESFAPVGASAADWDVFADADRWEPSPAIPPGTAIVPPELDPADFDAVYPFIVSAEELAEAEAAEERYQAEYRTHYAPGELAELRRSQRQD
jgi:hypothetical protein